MLTDFHSCGHSEDCPTTCVLVKMSRLSHWCAAASSISSSSTSARCCGNPFAFISSPAVGCSPVGTTGQTNTRIDCQLRPHMPEPKRFGQTRINFRRILMVRVSRFAFRQRQTAIPSRHGMNTSRIKRDGRTMSTLIRASYPSVGGSRWKPRRSSASMSAKSFAMEGFSSEIRIQIHSSEIRQRSIPYCRRERCSPSSSLRQWPSGVLKATSHPSRIQRFKAGIEA
jgi:hypothetical protein